MKKIEQQSWHGTYGGYTNHYCRCDDCRRANADRVAKARARRASAPIPEHVHGTVNGYNNYACRCRPCTDARNTEARRRYREKRYTAK